MDPSAIVAMMASAVGGLFGWVVKLQNNQISKLEVDKKELSDELKITALKVEQIIKTEQDATRQELSELRKTNATLVATISGREVAT
ncbi:MAG TPA: hypothetical protein VNJ04_19705 [Gemmatimonadaceae bacterium]|nr:hypothetical protein [Gemmatimonadaceae bacterium]